MPKHDFTPARTSEQLDGFLEYLGDKITYCSDKDERERLERLRRHTRVEHLASLYIQNAWIKLQLARG